MLAASVAAESQTYGLKADNSADSVYIKSSAKLEFFEGTGKGLVGAFQFDPMNPSAGATGLLRFDLRTIETGIAMRDEHMRERYLNTKDYPYCYYELTGVTGMPSQIQPDSTYQATGNGWFYIRGVKRTLPCTLSFTQHGSGDSTSSTITALFPVHLDDFKIPRPKAVFMKLAEQIDVTASFTGYPHVTGTAIQVPTEWPEEK